MLYLTTQISKTQSVTSNKLDQMSYLTSMLALASIDLPKQKHDRCARMCSRAKC